MGRYKVPMERIKNDKKRNLTYQTRKKGIIKKAHELTTLCEVNVAMIIRPDDHDQEPIIFPPDNPHKFSTLIDLYKENRKTDPGKIRYYSLSDYFKEKTMKVEEELAQLKKKNLEAKYPTWFDFLNDYKEAELRELAAKLETKIHHLKNKLIINNNNNTSKIQITQDNINTTSYPDDLFFDPEGLLDAIENKDPACPGDDFVNVDENNDTFSRLQSPQPAPYYFPPPEILASSTDQNMLVIQQSSNPNSLMKFPVRDDHNYSYNHNNSSPPLGTEYCFSPQTAELPPPLTDQNNVMMRTNSSVKLQLNIDDPRWYENFSTLQTPCPTYCSSPVNIIQQPETHNVSSNPDLVMKQQMSNQCFIDDHLNSLQPLPPCFQQETPQPHPELSALLSEYDLVMQSTSQPADSMMKLLMSEDDHDYCDQDNFSLQLPSCSEYVFRRRYSSSPSHY